MRDFFTAYRKELSATMEQMDTAVVEEIYKAIETARQEGRKVFVLGNGGSAAAASHWVCDFAKGINTDTSKRLRILAPSDFVGLCTAIGNDFSYDEIFERPLQNLMDEGDVVISLSVSGNSANLVKAHRHAAANGGKTIAIIGDYDGALAKLSDIVLVIPSKNYGIVEDIHMSVDHAISQYIYKQNLAQGDAET